ncbi:Tol biopolymer transport system component [Edaphobacter lichenicola]|uniref:Tol biopolymer transport system component n=3 Tax=Tunturiibacter TaxID=3154218 RepID=A0A852VIW6_9BACT|nr:Tol biopolymer transport system component [Edaphobacter lichenicola]
MKVLLTLSAQHGRVVSKEDLISAVWPDTFVSDDVLTRCISILRRITEDDPHTPHFIQTIPKVGYRLVAPVSELPIETQDLSSIHPSFSHAALPPPVLSQTSRWSDRYWIGWIVLIAVLILGALIAIWSYQRSKGRSVRAANSFRTIQFTSYSGEQIQPAFSPDGRKVAFVWISEDMASRRIYIKTIGTEEVKQLTSDENEQFSPTWSPDGSQIAYLARSNDGLSLSVANVSSQAAPHRLLIPQEPSHWEQGALSWAPSGSSLIYPDHSGTSPNSSIFLLDLHTFSTRSITTPPAGWEGDLNPAYSPNGKWIAFTRASETAVRDIYFMSTATGELHQLTHDHLNIDSLAWAADSSFLIFSSNRGGKYGLWKIGLKDKLPERLPVGTEDAYQPAVGPKAGELAYTQGSAIWSILRLQPSSGKETPVQSDSVLTSTQQDSAPALSPDGRFFAFQSRRSGNQEIWIASQSGDQLRQLTFMAGPLTGSPSWSNQGNKILFDSRPEGHSHIFCVPAAGGHPKQLTFGDANDITPRWSHDDQSIYFRSNRGDRWQLWRVPAAGGDPQPVTTGDGIVPQESPDGKWLYYTRGDEDGIWRVPPTGGAETQILTQPSAGYWGYWQITSRGIFYLDRGDSSSAIRLFNPDTKITSLYAMLKQTPPVYAGLTVAQDGKIVLLTDQHDAGRHITLIQALGE